MTQNSLGNTITFAPGDRLTTRGDDVDALFIILKGKVKAMTTYGTYYLGSGSIVGLTDLYYSIYLYNYFVEEETVVRQYDISSPSDIEKVIKDQTDNIGIFTIMQSRHISELITTYLELNMKCRELTPAFRPDVNISKWELDKYNSLSNIPNKIAAEYYNANSKVGVGILFDLARFSSTLNNACIQMAEKLDINLDYVEEISEDYALLYATDDTSTDITFVDEEFDEEAIITDLKKSLKKLLSYADATTEETNDFTRMINTFKNMKDRNALSDEARQLRRDIAKLYYKIYFKIFKKAVSSTTIPPLVSMFLNFGYVDEDFLSKESIIDLYKLTYSIEKLCHKNGVYTLFTWLREISKGNKLPSRNILDMDYSEHLKSELRHGKITAEEEKSLLADNIAKVEFEVNNMFSNANRGVFGRSGTFCPILSDDSTGRTFSNMLITSDKINYALDSITHKDYSAFYREVAYRNESLKIDHEFIMKEVRPDVILLPTYGTSCIMWQEIEGRRRDTPARFLMPVFTTSNVNNLLIELTGRFRWEMCKRIQGARWNNIAEKSLTSEYCDYIQFYKKNKDLSENAKEKVKTALTSCRNNYREVFVKDYELWLLYESGGSARLNKVSRAILATYCPFVAPIRASLEDNPLLKDFMNNGTKYYNSKRKRIDNIISTLEKKGKADEIPPEIKVAHRFFEM